MAQNYGNKGDKPANRGPKRRRGRPEGSLYPVRIHVAMTENMHDSLREAAANEDVTLTEFLRRILTNYLKNARRR